MKIFFITTSFLFLSSVNLVEAQPLITTEMSYQDVVKRFGPPKEKLEFAAKREEIWSYGKHQVRFKNGRAILPQPKARAFIPPPTPDKIEQALTFNAEELALVNAKIATPPPPLPKPEKNPLAKLFPDATTALPLLAPTK